jgi:hypothetical protein
MSVSSSWCNNGESCHGVEYCTSNGWCECPFNGLSREGQLASPVMTPLHSTTRTTVHVTLIDILFSVMMFDDVGWW